MNSDNSVDLTISNHQGNWWFRIESWGTCTGVTGTAINGIRGYKPGTYNVRAYSDSNCGTKIAESSFTIPSASLAATVNSDRSVDLTLTNGPTPWYFRISGGTCTTASGTTVSNIQGYKTGSYGVGAFSGSGCKNLIAHTDFTIPEPPPPTASLATTVNSDKSVDLNLTNGPGNWWFRINWWGTCTAVTGTSISNIQGYQPGTHPVDAYSDSDCSTKIASSSFTILALDIAATVNDDRSVNLTLTGGPVNWWFRINATGGECTAATGTTVSNIRGYPSGSYLVLVYPASGCAHGSHITATSFTIPTATLIAKVHGIWIVDLTLSNGPGDWWFRINSWGTCTAVTGPTISNIGGYQLGTHSVKAYSDSGCNYHVASTSFTMTTKPSAPDSPTVTDGNLELAVAWEAPAAGGSAITDYDLRYSSDSGANWTFAEMDAAANTALSYIITGLTNDTAYLVQARASNAQGDGPWSASASGTPQPPALEASNVTGTGATLTIARHRGNWYLKQTRPNIGTCSTNAITGATHTLGNLTPRKQHTYKAYSTAGCASANELATVTFTTPAVITASVITDTDATLNIAGHTGNWYFRLFTTSGNFGCIGPQSAATKSLNSSYLFLNANTFYGVSAHSGSGCSSANELDTVYFSTTDFGVTNLGPSAGSSCIVGRFLNEDTVCAIAFTTGSRSGGYTLSSVTGRFLSNTGTPDDIVVAIHAADTTNSINPASSALVTLEGNNPNTGLHTFTCSGVSCDLEPDTTYFVVMSDTAGGANAHYLWNMDSPGHVDSHPATNGWSIANEGRSKSGTRSWTPSQVGQGPMLHIAADVQPPPSLAASAITDTGATLTVTRHSGAWYYQRIEPADATCNTVSSGTTATLSSLTADTLYGYTAYADSTCTTALDTVYFSTTDVDVGNLAEAASASQCSFGYATSSNNQCAVAFTTGTFPGGYTLTSIAGQFAAKSGSPTNVSVAIHEADTNDRRNPAATAIANATFSGNDPDTAGRHSYTCAGSGCDLSASTTYFVVMSTADTSGNNQYNWTLTDSDAETTHPASNGWAIADAGRAKLGAAAWAAFSGADATRSPMLHIAADENPVTVSNLDSTRNTGRPIGKASASHRKGAAQFTTGSNTGGYDLISVTFEIDSSYPVVGTPGDLVVAIYSNDSNNKPDALVTTLTGTNPTGEGQHTYTCSSNCTLAASTKYHVHLDAPNATGTHNNYTWEATSSSSETLEPSNNGWSMGKSYYHSSNTNRWDDIPNYFKVKVTAMPK